MEINVSFITSRKSKCNAYVLSNVKPQLCRSQRTWYIIECVCSTHATPAWLWFLDKKRRLCHSGICVNNWMPFSEGSQQRPGCQITNNSGNKYLWTLHLSQAVCTGQCTCLTQISPHMHYVSSGRAPSNLSHPQWPGVKFCHPVPWRCPLTTLTVSRGGCF